MPIKIDRSKFMPEIKDYFGDPRKSFGDQAVDLADHVFIVSQKWFNEEPWKSDPELNTRRELRINLTRYIKNEIDFSDHRRSYFLPTFVWVYIAQQVIGWIVKKIIEHYWGDISKELPENN